MWTHPTHFACHQHRHIMGWRMSADMDQKWHERKFNSQAYRLKRQEILDWFAAQAPQKTASPPISSTPPTLRKGRKRI